MNVSTMCFSNLEHLTTDEKRQAWLKRHKCTLTILAEVAGVSVSVLSRSLRSATMPTNQHAALCAFGVPVDLLPEPLDKKRGPKAAQRPLLAVSARKSEKKD